jgi:hypothetical protein
VVKPGKYLEKSQKLSHVLLHTLSHTKEKLAVGGKQGKTLSSKKCLISGSRGCLFIEAGKDQIQ